MQLHEHLHRLTDVAEASAMDYMLNDYNGKLQCKIVANFSQLSTVLSHKAHYNG